MDCFRDSQAEDQPECVCVPVGVPRHVLELAALETAARCCHVQKGREIFLFPTEQKPILNILSDFA